MRIMYRTDDKRCWYAKSEIRPMVGDIVEIKSEEGYNSFKVKRVVYRLEGGEQTIIGEL